MVPQGSRRVSKWTGRLVVSLIAVALTAGSAVRAQEDHEPSAKDIVERIERLERLVEKLVERDIQARLAELIERFNAAIDHKEWSQAEALAREARELAPEEKVVEAMISKAEFIRNYNARPRGTVKATGACPDLSTPFELEQCGDPAQWRELTEARRTWLSEQNQRSTSAEERIAEALEKPVDVQFDNQPLSQVLDKLGDAAGVNIVLRADGLAKEGCSLDQPIKIELNEQTALSTALKLILEPLRLGHVIRNEVLEVTSQEDCRPETVTKVYEVADLVVPIAMAQSYSIPSGDSESVWVHPVAMAQVGPESALAAGERIEKQSSHKHSGMANPDFSPLVGTITEVIAPESWHDAGGPGAIHQSSTNLALVISQTEEVHEQIADLFEQLRRVLDEQVVLETRLLSIPDDFFERVGIDVAFSQGAIRPVTSVEIGEDGLERIGVDFDLPWSQGAVTPDDLAETGYAVLPPQQMKSLIEAVQEHAAAEILAAPKMTLFNGQRVVVAFGTIAKASDKSSPWSSVARRRKASSAPMQLSLSVAGVISNDRRKVSVTAQPQLARAAPPAASESKPLRNAVVVASAETDASQPAPPEGPQVRANVPDGCTLLVEAGELPGAAIGRLSKGKRLVVLVTPRIIVHEEESPQSLGNDVP